MSHSAMSWATRRRTGRPAKKVVLLALADMADPYGLAWPSARGIAEVTEQSPSTVRDVLLELESDGVLWRCERRRRNGTQASSLFLLAPPGCERGEMKDPRANPAGCDERVEQLFGDGPNPDPSTPAEPPAQQTPDTGTCGTDRHREAAQQTPEPGTPTTFEPSLEPPLAAAGERASEPSDLDRALEQLKPIVRAGQLADPMIDGSWSSLASAVETHGLPLVTSALDHVIAWASSTERPMRRRNLSFHLPSALERARRIRRDDQGTPGDRPPFAVAIAKVDEAVSGGKDALTIVTTLKRLNPMLALLLVTLGGPEEWRRRPSGDSFGARSWESNAKGVYQRLHGDLQPVDDYLDRLHRNRMLREAIARGENPYDPEHPLNQPGRHLRSVDAA